jgi:hypothetical protein
MGNIALGLLTDPAGRSAESVETALLKISATALTWGS